MTDEVSDILSPAEAGDPGESLRRANRRVRKLSLAPAVVFVGFWLGVPWLVIQLWLAPVLPGGWALFGLGIVAGAFAIRTLARGFLGLHYPSALTRILVLRPFWYAMLFLPLLGMATLVGGFVGFLFGEAHEGGLWGLGLASVVLAVTSVAGYQGSRQLTRKRLDVRLPRLPEALDGLRVVQISDLHVGPHSHRGFLRRVRDCVMREEPDLIAITGDQVDDFDQDVKLFNEAFSELVAPLGVYAVPGNHDVYAGWEGVHRGLAEGGTRVLVNEAVQVEHRGHRFWVVGTGDPAAKHWPGGDALHAAPDIERTLAGVPEDDLVLALAHNPGLWPRLAARSVDLTLSGHTHHGQFSIPSRDWSMASMFLEHAMGWHRRGDALLYINPGTNYWGIPFRIGAVPEVTVLTLRVAGDGEAGVEEI